MESFEQSQDDFNKAEFETRIRTIKEIITEFAGDNPKLSALLMQVVNGIEKNKERFLGQDISVIINLLLMRRLRNMQKNGIWILRMSSMRFFISETVNLQMRIN